MNSGFADRGLTTWLPRRINLPDLIRWLCAVPNGNRAYMYYRDSYKVNGQANPARSLNPDSEIGTADSRYFTDFGPKIMDRRASGHTCMALPIFADVRFSGRDGLRCPTNDPSWQGEKWDGTEAIPPSNERIAHRASRQGAACSSVPRSRTD